VVPSATGEALEGGPASVLAEKNALAKMRGAVLPAGVASGAFVLGTDTLVTVDGRVMGKPASAREAAQMLAHLSGRTHQVVSGMALGRIAGLGAPVAAGEARVACAVTDVTFMALQPADIAAYVASAEWKGKAGAYAIQGLAASYVSEVRGEYSNVVGLPLCLLACTLREAGFDLLRRAWL